VCVRAGIKRNTALSLEHNETTVLTKKSTWTFYQWF